MKSPALINIAILEPILAEIPRHALEVYILLMARLSRINFQYKVWQTNIVIYPDQELPYREEIESIREYLLKSGLVISYQNEGFWEMTKPDTCGILFYKNQSVYRDRKLLKADLSLAKKLKEFRWDNNLTQKKMAKLLNVPYKTYATWELGAKPCKRNMRKLKPLLRSNDD